MTEPQSPVPLRPAWTTGWLWAGLGVFFSSLLIASRALGGFGNPSGCGTFGLSCVGNALAWLCAVQGLAAPLLWMAVPRLTPRSGLKQICILIAVGSSLVFLVGCWVVLTVMF